MRFKRIMPFSLIKPLQRDFPKENEALRFASPFMLGIERRESGKWASSSLPSPPMRGEGEGRWRCLNRNNQHGDTGAHRVFPSPLRGEKARERGSIPSFCSNVLWSDLVQRPSCAGSALDIFRQPRASSSASDAIPCRGLNVKARRGRGARGGFTLAEVLAALLFMAIVIPVAVEGLRMANLAGQVGQRKAAAARLAEQTLNELIITEQWRNSIQNGVLREGPLEYRWNVQWSPWITEPFRVMTVEVTFPVQGKDYSVQLSTLIDTTPQ